MPATKEEKTGVITNYYDNDSGKIKEDGSGEDLEFFHPGAKLEFGDNPGVGYLKVTTPSGQIIINGLKKKV